MADLRDRVEAAIRSVALDTDLVDDDGKLVIVHVDNVLDAVMAVVDAARLHAFHNPRGRCRWCGVVTSEVLTHGRPLAPHLMTCRFYVGPVEHRVNSGFQMLTHWATECSCGESWDRERSDACPNSSETWRGPMPQAGESDG